MSAEAQVTPPRLGTLASQWRDVVDSPWPLPRDIPAAWEWAASYQDGVSATRIKCADDLDAALTALRTQIAQLEDEIRAAYEALKARALSPDVSAETAAYMGAPGRTVRQWADTLRDLQATLAP